MQNVIKNNESIKAKHIATLASGLGLVLTTSAQAAVVYTDVTPDWVRSVSAEAEEGERFEYEIDFNADSVIDVAILVGGFDGYYGKIVFANSTRSNGMYFVGTGRVDPLNSGSTIGEDSSLTYSSYFGSNGQYGVYGNVINAGRTFVGAKFVVDGDTKYGWIGLEFSAPTRENATMTVFDFAYEDSGASIKAGDKGAPSVAVPEPSSMALLATGALAIAGFRRRKRQQKVN